jgi:hypothetical protein
MGRLALEAGKAPAVSIGFRTQAPASPGVSVQGISNHDTRLDKGMHDGCRHVLEVRG